MEIKPWLQSPRPSRARGCQLQIPGRQRVTDPSSEQQHQLVSLQVLCKLKGTHPANDPLQGKLSFRQSRAGAGSRLVYSGNRFFARVFYVVLCMPAFKEKTSQNSRCFLPVLTFQIIIYRTPQTSSKSEEQQVQECWLERQNCIEVGPTQSLKNS